MNHSPSRRRVVLSLALGALMLLAVAGRPAHGASDRIVYGSGFCPDLVNYCFYEVDIGTADLTVAGPRAFSSAAIARSPVDGLIYYTEWNVTNGRVATFDPDSQTSNVIGNLGSGVNKFARLGFRSDGALFGMDDSCRLYTVSTTDGSASFVGTVTGASCTGGDLAFAPDDTLYICADLADSRIYVVNLGTLTATLVHDIAAENNVAGLAVADEGVFYSARYLLAAYEPGSFLETSIGSFPGGAYLSDVASTPKFVDLSLNKTVDDPTPAVGGTITFTLSVTNAGPADATSVIVADLLPSGYSYVSDDGGGAYDSGSGVWTVDTVAVGGTATLNILSVVNATGDYDNVAEIIACNEFDTDSTPDNHEPAEDDQDNVMVARQPLSIVKRAFQLDGTPIPTGSTVPRGTPIKFLLYINNRGGSVSDVSMQDVLDSAFLRVPESTKYDNSSPNCAATACTGVEEAAIFAAADSGTSGTDAVDTDVVSFTGVTLDIGNQNTANAQLDIAGGKVWAAVFTVQMQ
ncbi:MAG: DUF11 domain-containing protein [bacterium]|nr:DUF11 domain-containing protein [bacterium]